MLPFLGWLCILRKWSKEDAIKEASSSNTTNKVSRKKLFKLFFQSPERIETNISLKLPLTIVTLIMNVPPIIAIPFINVLRIQLLKYHDNGDPTLHIQQLTEVCVINGEDTNCHKLQYFPNSSRGKVAALFGRYEIAHPTMTWAKVQRAFITRFNEIRSERQATIAS